jgi:hypothetical protein
MTIRAAIMSEREATIAEHQPDDDGICRACPTPTIYPCQVLLIAEDTVDKLRRRLCPRISASAVPRR